MKYNRTNSYIYFSEINLFREFRNAGAVGARSLKQWFLKAANHATIRQTPSTPPFFLATSHTFHPPFFINHLLTPRPLVFELPLFLHTTHNHRIAHNALPHLSTLLPIRIKLIRNLKQLVNALINLHHFCPCSVDLNLS
jgi:hypothetical protein